MVVLEAFGARVSSEHHANEVFTPTPVSHSIMKQRLGEDAIAWCYSEKMEKMQKNEKIKKK